MARLSMLSVAAAVPATLVLPGSPARACSCGVSEAFREVAAARFDDVAGPNLPIMESVDVDLPPAPALAPTTVGTTPTASTAPARATGDEAPPAASKDAPSGGGIRTALVIVAIGTGAIAVWRLSRRRHRRAL